MKRLSILTGHLSPPVEDRETPADGQGPCLFEPLLRYTNDAASMPGAERQNAFPDAPSDQGSSPP